MRSKKLIALLGMVLILGSCQPGLYNVRVTPEDREMIRASRYNREPQYPRLGIQVINVILPRPETTGYVMLSRLRNRN